jgi:hypothetical protein
MRWHLRLVILFVLIVGGGGVAVWRHAQVPAAPDAIVEAMFPVGKGEQYYSDDQVIRAIRSYGDVNGFSARQNLSFLSAAVAMDNRRVRDWLLSHGATVNPAHGMHPLAICVANDDDLQAKLLLNAGAKWSAPTADGSTVRAVAEKNNPRIVERLDQWMAPKGANHGSDI